MGGDVVSVNLAFIKMVKTAVILASLVSCIAADVYTTSTSFVVKVGKIKKTANCDVTISYTGDVASMDGSSVQCSIPWPKKNPLTFNTVKTALDSVESTPVTADASFYPTSLWCPQEDTLIFGTGNYDSIVNEAAADNWEQCAQRCSEYTNESGNAPCFSWT